MMTLFLLNLQSMVSSVWHGMGTPLVLEFVVTTFLTHQNQFLHVREVQSLELSSPSTLSLKLSLVSLTGSLNLWQKSGSSTQCGCCPGGYVTGDCLGSRCSSAAGPLKHTTFWWSSRAAPDLRMPLSGRTPSQLGLLGDGRGSVQIYNVITILMLGHSQ